MADKWPLAGGNWSNAANWNGGTVPVDGDTVYCDGRVITFDVDVVQPNTIVRNSQRAGGTQGGSVVFPANRSVTVGEWRATTNLLISSIGANCVIGGDLYGGSSLPGRVMDYSNASTLIINGDAYGGSSISSGSNNSAAVYNSGGGHIVINGSVYGGTGGGGFGYTAISGGAGTFLITGDVVGGSLGPGVFNPNAGTILGNVVAGTGAPAVSLTTPTAFVAVLGDAIGGSVNAVSVTQGTIQIEGNAVSSPGAITINFGASAGVDCYVNGIMHTNGHPFPVTTVRLKDSESLLTLNTLADGAVVFADADGIGDPPTESDVREGVLYQFGIREGTLAVAAPQYVSQGVPTDDTVGTLVVDLQPILDALDDIVVQPSVGIHRVSVVVVDGDENQVPGVSLEILGVAGTKRVTATSGSEVIDLNPGDYSLRVTTPPGYLPVADISLTVNADVLVTVPIEVQPTTALVPGSDQLITTKLSVVNQFGQPVSVGTVTATVLGFAVFSGNNLVVNTAQQRALNSQGIAIFSLYRGLSYRIVVRVGQDIVVDMTHTIPTTGDEHIINTTAG